MAFRLKASRVLGIFVLFSLILLVSQLSRFRLFGWDCSIHLLVRYIRPVIHSIPWIVFNSRTAIAGASIGLLLVFFYFVMIFVTII